MVGFGGFHKAVNDGACFSAPYGVDIDPVFAAKSKRTDRPFRSVIVHGYVFVVEKNPQIFFMIQAVLHGLKTLVPDTVKKMLQNITDI